MDSDARSPARKVARRNDCVRATGNLELVTRPRLARDRFLRPLGDVCGSVTVDCIPDAGVISRLARKTKYVRAVVAACDGRDWLCTGCNGDARLVGWIPDLRDRDVVVKCFSPHDSHCRSL